MNTRIYGQLLSETVPAVITSDKEYDRIEELFANMINKNRSPEEDNLFDLFTNLLEDYEKRTLPPIKKTTPIEMLKFLMDENNLRQIDLVDIFSSQGIVSEVLAGKRQITLSQAKKLAKRFKLSVEAFI